MFKWKVLNIAFIYIGKVKDAAIKVAVKAK